MNTSSNSVVVERIVSELNGSFSAKNENVIAKLNQMKTRKSSAAVAVLSSLKVVLDRANKMYSGKILSGN